MDEAEWLASRDPQTMLRWLGETASDRKRRLYACACCRRLPSLLDRDHDREALATIERFADGLATRAELWAAYRAATEPAIYGAADRQSVHASEAAGTVCAAAVGNARLNPAHPYDQGAFDTAVESERVAQSALIRDIFGNPFRPVSFLPEWRTSTVLALAQQMYESRDFSAMPILADALQDAGCESEAILAHYRGPGPHVRGCFCVDAILGKT